MTVVDAPHPARGLTSEQVVQRITDGRVNLAPRGTTRTTLQILIANIINPVNAIIMTLFALILVAGYPADGLFVGVVVANSIIGILQELAARRALHRLELLNAPVATVIRDGETLEIAVEEIVVDDLLVLRPGEQIVVDGAVISAEGLEADESMLTGESDPVDKGPGAEVLSGSFVNAGSGTYQATRVGGSSYANALAAEAKRFELVHSELRRGINKVLRVLIVLIPPAAVLLFLSLLHVEDRWQDALQGTVAGAVAMVPDGLVLLTSLTFMAGVIALARRQALAKELATVELLARVDILCLDKTGTITTGEISFGSTVALRGHTDAEVADSLGAMAAADPNPNPTMAAVASTHPAPDGWEVVAVAPFSSARKWSATEFAGRGTYYFGAPDILLDDDDLDDRAKVLAEAEQGRRVLLVTRSDEPLGDELPSQRRPVALVLLEDTVRTDAPDILRFFAEQGVELKVISGDNVATVAAVAAKAGIPNASSSMDARELSDDPEELAEALATTTVFGRVTPHQKRAMVGALQSRGRIVAMTGDGVNDVLALKDADMGIAMGSGSSASRGVAQLVLLDNRFATLPEVLAQGRKVINNIERVANLFLTKAVYALLLTTVIGIQQVEFPFLPRHLTLVGTFTIGLPGFFLALAPNVNLVRSGFLQRVLRFSIPAGIVTAIGTWASYQFARGRMLGAEITAAELDDARSAATITLLGIGLVTLVVVSRPLRLWKVGLACAMAACYAVILAWDLPREYFELTIPEREIWLACLAAVAAAGVTIVSIPRIVPGLRMAARIGTSTSDPDRRGG